MPSGTKTACPRHAVLCFANENNLLARNLLTIRPKITLMAYMKIGLATIVAGDDMRQRLHPDRHALTDIFARFIDLGCIIG